MLKVSNLLRAASSFCLRNTALNLSKPSVRYSSVTTWNKDWMPGPYPRTKEERIAAAKKYNMLPEDYEPYPEEEGYGDYPKFPPTHMEYRSDFEVYDFPVLKRNYGEPLHPDFDLLLEDKANFQKEYAFKPWQMVLMVVTFVSAYCGILYWDEMNPPDLKRIPKQYPHRGYKSYTFEPTD